MGKATEFNRDYYDQLTAGRENYWNLMPAPRMRIDSVIAAIRRYKPLPSSICDFGCGNGVLLGAIREHYPELPLSGIDLSEEQIAHNTQVNPSTNWAAADLTSDEYRFPFEKACDVAISSEVIEHLDRPLEYLKNIYASLDRDGLTVLTTQSGPVHATETYVGHVRHWEAAAMKELFTSAGFRELRISNCGYPFHDLSKWAANLRPRLIMQRFGEEEWGPAQKFTAFVLRFLFRFNSSRRGYQLVATARK